MKILTVVGARPQFVKMAPVSIALRPGHSEYVVHTGQHYDDSLSGAFFRDLAITAPDANLGVGSGSHAEQTAAALIGIERTIREVEPDLVIVYGDTNSTLAGALAAAKSHVAVAHIEAGLRSFRRFMAEEINRVLVDHCSDLLFAPTPGAVDNLAREGLTDGVHWAGDVMFDCALNARPAAEARLPDLVAALGVEPGQFLLATVHRAENTDQRMNLEAILRAFGKTGERVILPVHPRTRKMLDAFDLVPTVESIRNLTLCEPLGYLEMLALEGAARVVLTDSGGVQKEAYFAGTPVVTLREETEWQETVDAGWNQLAGVDPAAIVAAVERARPGKPIPDYGDGTAARRIAEVIDSWAAEGR